MRRYCGFKPSGGRSYRRSTIFRSVAAGRAGRHGFDRLREALEAPSTRGHEILGARGRPKSGRMACRARGGCGTFSDSDHGSATGTVWGSQGKRGRRSGIQRCSDKAYTNWVPQTIQDARAQSGQADPRVSLPEWKAALAAQWFGQKRPTRLPMQRLRSWRQLGSAFSAL